MLSVWFCIRCFYLVVSSAACVRDPLKIPYSVFFALWSMSFLASWKCRENEYKYLWGTEGHEQHEKPRPEFKGKHVVNSITGKATIEYQNALIRLLVQVITPIPCTRRLTQMLERGGSWTRMDGGD